MRAARVFLVVLGLLATGASVDRLARAADAVRAEHVNDALPLWLGAWALRAGQDPQSPENQALQAARHPTGTRPGGWFNPYPPTASLLALPTTLWPWSTFVQRWTLLGAVAAGLVGGLGALAGPLRDRWMSLGGAAIAAAIVGTHPGIEVCLRLGNVNLLMLAFAAAGMAALGQRRDVLAGLVIFLGAGWKIAPVALVVPPLLAGRWRPAAVVLGGLLAAAAVIGLVYLAPVALADWWAELGRTAGFYWKGFDVDVVGRDLRRPAFVATGLVLSAVVVRRHAVPEACVAGFALLGMLSVYSPFRHEGVLVLPALGAILGAPLRRGVLALDLVLAALVGGAYAWAWPTSAELVDDPVRWVVFGWALWGAAMVRFVVAAARG